MTAKDSIEGAPWNLNFMVATPLRIGQKRSYTLRRQWIEIVRLPCENMLSVNPRHRESSVHRSSSVPRLAAVKRSLANGGKARKRFARNIPSWGNQLQPMNRLGGWRYREVMR